MPRAYKTIIMVCDICRKTHATIHLTEIVEGKAVEMHICQDCAQSKAKILNEHLHLSGFVGGLAQDSDNKKEIQIKCPLCGLRFEEFRAKGRLGCGQCYQVFRRQLMPLIKKIHGSVRHVGKAPVNVKPVDAADIVLKELRLRLQRAVQLEEYEQAARLRDELKKLENK